MITAVDADAAAIITTIAIIVTANSLIRSKDLDGAH